MENNTINLEDLLKKDNDTAEVLTSKEPTKTSGGIRKVEINEIAPPSTKQETTIRGNVLNQLNILDQGLMEKQKEIYETIAKPIEETDAELAMEDDLTPEQIEAAREAAVIKASADSEVNPVENKVEVEINEETKEEAKEETTDNDIFDLNDSSNDIMDELEKELSEDDDDEEEDDAEEQEEMNSAKEAIKEVIKPITNTINLKDFKIRKKPVSASALLNTISKAKSKTADWVLYSGKRSISVSALTTTELDRMNPNELRRSNNTLNIYKQIFSTIYEHLVDSNKPATLEAWVKTIPFYDINHIYWAVYRACYSSSNFVPYMCDACKKTSLIDIPIEDMVKYSSDEVKKEIASILAKETTSSSDYITTPYQISDDYVVDVKIPSVYNVVFENAALDRVFLEKYSDILAMISYIDGIYLIDRETSELCPIEIKTEVDNFAKNVKRKILTYSKILNTLDSDQYGAFNTFTANLMKEQDVITYIRPERKCPKCGKVIKEETIDPLETLFTRHQLVLISSL